jgi:hypothetical protein
MNKINRGLALGAAMLVATSMPQEQPKAMSSEHHDADIINITNLTREFMMENKIIGDEQTCNWGSLVLIR